MSPARRGAVFGALAGALVSALLLWLAVRRLDARAVLDAVASARPLPWVAAGVVSYLAGHVVRGLRCRLLLRHGAALDRVTATNVVVVGYAVNNLLPARLGELARAGMLAERSGVSGTTALVVTLLERLLDGLVILGLLVVGSRLSGVDGRFAALEGLAAVVFGVAATGVLAAALAPRVVERLVARLASVLPVGARDRAVGLASQVSAGLSLLREPRAAASAVGWSVVVWTLESGLFYGVARSFGLDLPYAGAVVAMAVTNLGLLAPSTPGYVGPFHWFCAQALGAFGVPTETAFAVAVVTHASFYVPVTLWGLAALARYGVEVGALVAAGRAARTLPVTDGTAVRLVLDRPPRVAELVPSAFLSSVVDAFTPADVAPPHRAEVVEHAARFVAGQVSALPWMLRAALAVGLSAFRVLVFLRYFSVFEHLPLERRASLVTAWAWGRVSLARQLFKVLRATALLAVGEHPRVAGRRSPAVELRVVAP